MRNILGSTLLIILLFVSCSGPENSGSSVAETPPMGWNSFDSYGVYLHHDAAMKNLEAFAKKLKPSGYEYFVIDAGWFGEFKLKEGTMYPMEKHAEKLNFNEYGLVQPSKTYFPHGFQPIIDRCHELGLKFGLHLMRGIPREVVRLNLPVKGTTFHAADIADTTSICEWNPQNYGVDMDKPGAQEYYNSLIDQMARWGVDLIKYDDIVPFPREVEAVAKAIAACGRPVVLSMSPGGSVDQANIGFFKKGNMLRVTHDIWDDQEGIDACFKAWRKWQGKEEPGFWIDMDMIPFGQLQLMSPKPEGLNGDESKSEIVQMKKNGELTNVELLAGKGWQRRSKFTRDQMYTFITLRALAASPLMVGGDLPSMDDFSLSLLTNRDMIQCNQNGVMGSLAYENNGIEVWNTPEKGSGNGWIGIFNRSADSRSISLTPAGMGLQSGKEYTITDIWNDRMLENDAPCRINPGGVVFIRYEENV